MKLTRWQKLGMALSVLWVVFVALWAFDDFAIATSVVIPTAPTKFTELKNRATGERYGSLNSQSIRSNAIGEWLNDASDKLQFPKKISLVASLSIENLIRWLMLPVLYLWALFYWIRWCSKGFKTETPVFKFIVIFLCLLLCIAIDVSMEVSLRSFPYHSAFIITSLAGFSGYRFVKYAIASVKDAIASNGGRFMLAIAIINLGIFSSIVAFLPQVYDKRAHAYVRTHWDIAWFVCFGSLLISIAVYLLIMGRVTAGSSARKAD